MAIQRFRVSVPPGSADGLRLDQALADLLPKAMGEPVSRGKARKLIIAGAVYVNRRRVRVASRPVHAGAAIEVVLDPVRWEGGKASATNERVELGPSQVVYEDGDLIVVNKPAGLPTQPTLDQARDHLFASVKRLLASRPGAPREPYVGLHHRLDVDTSGLVLFTKTKRANPGVGRLFAEHGIQKTYQALALRPGGGAPGEKWVVKNFLGRLPGPKKPSRFGAVRSGGDAAETRFRLLADLPGAAAGKGAGPRVPGGALWVEAEPLTGRTHQIRVHLSEAGMPILGDRLYGRLQSGAPEIITRLMLHAARLRFRHPITEKELVVEAPLPPDFQAALAALR
ncbi:MAG: RluA family pseudouridine synthase [Bdellovibrionales bacterium]|nr:RluA family pseudouridine synthase [Bdellovibrionales bacterium]